MAFVLLLNKKNIKFDSLFFAKILLFLKTTKIFFFHIFSYQTRALQHKTVAHWTIFCWVRCMHLRQLLYTECSGGYKGLQCLTMNCENPLLWMHNDIFFYTIFHTPTFVFAANFVSRSDIGIQILSVYSVCVRVCVQKLISAALYNSIVLKMPVTQQIKKHTK